MNTSPSFAKMGAETGGGGDAVMINGVAVIRDIVAQNLLTQVRDNLTIIRNLASVRFYI